MRKTCHKLGLILIALALCTGCWNKRELNELAIASAMGLDISGDTIQVTVQLVNTGEISNTTGGGMSRMPIVSEQLAGGQTTFESIRQLTTAAPRKIYSSHIQILVIGEKLARAGIAQVLDGLSRDHELRSDFYILVAKGESAASILKMLTPLEKIPSNKMFNSLEGTEQSWGGSTKVTLHDLIYDLVSKGKDPALAAITIFGDSSKGDNKSNLEAVDAPAQLAYDGIAVFRGDKLVGWLNQTDSRGFNFIANNINSTVINVDCPDGGKIALEVIRSKTRMKGSLLNGQPRIELEVRTEANVGEVACTSNLDHEEAIEKLERQAAQVIESEMMHTIKRAKKLRSDLFGFGDAIHRAAPRAWNQLRDQWEQEFVELPVEVISEVEIRRMGSVIESFMERMGE